ncbi:hypothetical protein BP5796_12945 [Coleophoma crateriformis]|uniref:Major facilitator superfamily (MFS) profile domain-containing protein n=1 Tax=Coleophoma crateriformis TaxID=565419 RepID=A0A3D8Q5F2_9HELO|nr:hypothetical protein BP5796_12945 [Coleophoma crateriformis]
MAAEKDAGQTTHVDDTHQDISVVEAITLADDVQTAKQSPWTMANAECFGVLVSASSSTGFIFAIYSIGSCCATPFTGPVNDRLGRRAGIFTAAIVVMIGTIVTALAPHKNMFLAGRFILGFGACFGNVSGPVYVSEMAHPLWRGTTMGLYGSFGFLGQILAVWVIYAAQYQPNGFRIPIWGQFIPAGLIVTFVWLIPESPRWLMAQGREEAAQRVLIRYHGQRDPENPVAKVAFREMQHQINTDGSDKKWWNYSELWSTRSRRRRLIIVVGMACIGQWSGNSSTSFYFPVMVANAGITSQHTKLLLNGINAPLGFFAVLFGARFSDRFGRRPLMLGSLAIVIVLLYTLSAVSKYAYTHTGNHSAANATIAIIYIFSIVVSGSLGTLSPVYIPECLETNSRAKGKSLALLVVSACSAIVTYASGPAFQHLKYYFYLVFATWDILEWAVIFFFFPETKGRTLEELEEVFSAKNPVKKSLEKRSAQTVLNTLEVSEKAGEA